MKPLWRFVIGAAIVGAGLAGCSTLGYYTQAAQGQIALLADSRPIDEVIADPATTPQLKIKLATARQIRAYAVASLALPDNKSYRNYTALHRPYVVWNVVATPALSLKPIQWCFPVAGCVNYRGYYAKEDANAYARELRDAGYDVQVGGVSAYSTLGYFNDPLISTFINYPDAELARLIFHELSHQVVYVAGDSQFNESFASAVEEAGVEQWLTRFGNQTMRDNYAKYTARRQDFLQLLLACRRALEANYKSKASDADKLREKARLFAQLQTDYAVLKVKWGGYAGYDRFFAEPLSNAHLAAVATYSDFVPAFGKLLQQSGSFPAFYEAARRLAALDKPERTRRLLALGGIKSDTALATQDN